MRNQAIVTAPSNIERTIFAASLPYPYVAVVMTAPFLAFSKAQGNDLSTPMPQYGFAGLKPGDRWCLCASRWKEALDAGAAPQVVLEATHAVTLHVVSLDELKKYAFRLQ